MPALDFTKKPFRKVPGLFQLVFGWHSSTKLPLAFERTRTIFIHVPKAAGTSIALALYGEQIPHTRWRELYETNPYKFKNYFKFAVIRDPVSRFVSSFDFLKVGGMHGEDKEFSEKVLTPFANANELAKRLVDPKLQQQVFAYWHFKPQSFYVADGEGLSRVDLLLRYENLAAGFERLKRQLKREDLKLPHVNKTPSRQPTVLDQESLDVLDCLYRKDFVLWKEQAS
jgi:hypothetical protein